MTFAYYPVQAGAWIHEHSHPNDEVWNVIDGQLEITRDQIARLLRPEFRALPPFVSADASLIRLSRICVGVQAANPNTNAGFSFA